MSSNKKRRVEDCDLPITGDVRTVVPDGYKDKVNDHINSVYVGTILRIYDRKYSIEGQLATAHWATDQGVYVTLHDEQRSDFITLKYKTWVVDHRPVKPGAFRLFTRPGTDDMRDENRILTINEKKQKNNRILMNNMVMNFPTQRDQQTYECALFKLTCNCGYSKKLKKYTCSHSNRENGGQKYYGCVDKYSMNVNSCNFFVWENEIEHETYQTCKCGILCKKVNIGKKGSPPNYKFVCVNGQNKNHQGCNAFYD